ncbi:unnamed protein product [Acanthoscelides obtectus]|uniref:MADF domain-containing protein n=2 Tax=Acanthoscelides obtectus TaxID=200917 RepID=A0A9P0P4F7_ACAOB|nr:unnamed protein product [Acanthoscelides obtectus]CAK1633456.1 hypothetical protein AOBTE_LOCUS8149 [Acanthoscelides obtectus]
MFAKCSKKPIRKSCLESFDFKKQQCPSSKQYCRYNKGNSVVMRCEMEDLDIEAFISMVEERPVIWDKTREDFKDRNKTKAAWQEIIDTFIYENLNEAEKAEIAKTLLQKWNNFFDSFVKSYKKNKTPKSGSGFRRIRKYIFHDQLQFLAKTIEHNTTTSSISQEKIQKRWRNRM